MVKDYTSFIIRPYQLMCIVCKIGGGFTSKPEDKKLADILRRVKENPNLPLTLRCNVDGLYRYQNPGDKDDTSEGKLYNIKRDLDILQLTGLVPGATRPARELFSRLLKNITTSRGICGYGSVESKTWKGCTDTDSGNYEKGRAKGLNGIIPARNEEEFARTKKKYLKIMREAKKLLIRPHHLMCFACVYGGENYDEENPANYDIETEAIKIMHKNPEIQIVLSEHCMICPLCLAWEIDNNWCISGIGMGLRDQKKDMEVLQKLGLKFGDTLPAKKMYKLLFEKIHSTKEICGWGDGIVRSPEWSICGGTEGNKSYERARAKKLGFKNF